LGIEESDSLFDDIPSLSSVATNKHSLNGSWNPSDEEITFSGKLRNCCICFIDMISSTKVSSKLNPEQIGKYYAIFLNSTAIIAKNFGATIIKNAGDSLIYYFPNATESTEGIGGDAGDAGDAGDDDGKNSMMAFKDVIECSMTIISARDIVNSKLYEEKLPSLNYRISAEYGTVEFAKSVSSQSQDLFGPTMNFCAKINSLAPPNGMIIGDSLYQIVKSFDEYEFEKMGEYPPPDMSLQDSHASNCVYVVTSKRKKTILNPFSRTPNTMPLQNVSSPLVGGGKHNSPKSYHHGSSSSSSGGHSPKTRTNNKIMIVDDDEDVLFTFKTFLQSEGWNVDAFANPQEALSQFERDAAYGLVITDIKMPNLNGLELYNKMKSKNSDTRVLFVSALDGAEMILSVFPDLTEKNLIKKPVEKEEMIKTIKSMLCYGNENGGGW
jgi:CheY-like chemotaxis protein